MYANAIYVGPEVSGLLDTRYHKTSRPSVVTVATTPDVLVGLGRGPSMNVSKMLRPTRKILATAAVAVVAAACVVSVNTTSATTGHAKPNLTQATKEWKTEPLGTKEW